MKIEFKPTTFEWTECADNPCTIKVLPDVDEDLHPIIIEMAGGMKWEGTREQTSALANALLAAVRIYSQHHTDDTPPAPTGH